MPQITTAAKKDWKEPIESTAAATIAVKPAAGPLTLNGDLLIDATTIPPTIPAMIPLNAGAFDAIAIPKHNGNAIRKTTIEDGKSDLRCVKYFFI